MANEKRLIDATIMPHGQFWEGLTDKEKAKVLAYLVMSPTVDAVEVVHGQWLFVTKGQQTSVYVCSKCNRAVTVVCDEDKIKEQLAKRYPYCHCGAKMDGGNEDG